MPIFQKDKNQREATSLQQLQVFSRSSQLKPVDLCSHNYLIQNANIFPKIQDQNETILNDLQQMIQKMQAIVLERAAVVARDVTDSEKEMVAELVGFINLQILQIPKCQSLEQDDQAQRDSSFSHISKTGLEYAYIAFQRFGKRIKNFAQARTFNYIFDTVQLIIVQFRDFLLGDCLQKEQEDGTIPIIQTLLILMASIQDKRSNDLSKQFSLKEETYRTLIYIVNRVTNVSTLNFAVKVLEINEKDYPTDFDEAHEFSLKMVVWSELTNFSILNNIKEADEKIQIRLDFEPEIAFPKKYNYSERKKMSNILEAVDGLYLSSMSTDTSESDHDDMLSNYVTLSNPVSNFPKRAAKLFCNLQVDIKTLTCLPKAFQEQLSKQNLEVPNEDRVTGLRDSAKAILQWAYNEVRNQVLERGEFSDRILAWEEYSKKYEKYIDRGVLPILEAELVYALQFAKERVQLLQLGVSSLEKIFNRIQNFEGLYGNYFTGLKDPLKIKHRVKSFVKNDIIDICFKFVEKSYEYENQQINEQNVQLLEQSFALFYWKLLCLLIKQIRKSQTFNPHQIHPVLKKLLCNEDKNNQMYDGTKAFLLDLLTQTNYLTYEGQTLNDLTIKQTNKNEDDDEKFTKQVNIGCYLLTNYHFQNYLWKVAGCVYTTVCSLIKDIPGQILQSTEIHKLCQTTKHDLEIVGQIQLLKMPKQLESGQQIFINSSSSVIQLIASTLIRSSWVTEGVTVRQQQEDQPETLNINKLINLLFVYLKALSDNTAHTVVSTVDKKENYVSRKIKKEKLVQAINSIMSRITLDRHNPNHPQNYYEIIIQSQLFNQQTFGSVYINYIENETEISQIALCKLNLQFILFLTNVFQNDPSQVGKLVDNGFLRSLINFLIIKIMPLKITFINIISLLQAISIHEKGLALIKETNIFDKYMMPSSEVGYKKMAILVAQDTNENWRNYHELADLLRHNDQYFIERTKKVFSAIFADVIPKIKVLQKQFYDHLSQYFKKNSDQEMSSTLVESSNEDLPSTKSYNKFLVEVTEKLSQTEEYYLVKYELWKIRMTNNGSQECLLTKFFQVYTMLSTVKPVFEYNQQPKRPREHISSTSSLFQDLNVIVNSVINQENNMRGEHHISTFAKFLQDGIKQTKQTIIQIANAVESNAAQNPYSFSSDHGEYKKVTELKEVDWVDMLTKIDKGTYDVQLKDLNDGLLSEISSSNLRGHIIARISGTTQICEAYLKLSRQIQQAIAQQVNWERETIDLQGLQFSLMRSNNQCTGLFFSCQSLFQSRYYITPQQSKLLSFIFKSEITSEQEMILKRNRKSIEGNLENFRQDLLFFQTGSNEISSVLNMMSEAWIDRRRDTKNNKAHFQKLINVTIADLKISYLIGELETETKRSLNSPRFLAGLSHLFFVVSLLNEFILRGLVDGQGFVMFIDKGFLREIIQIFTFLRKLNLKKMIKESTFDEETASKEEIDKCLNFVAYSCYQSICRDIKGMISKFITLNNSLANFNEPTLLEILKTDDLYESEQQFFCNYFYQLTSGLLYQDGNKGEETKFQPLQIGDNKTDQNMEDGSEQEKTQNSWVIENPQLPELNRTLHDNNDIKEIQIQIVASLSNLFQKCKYLKEGEFSQKLRNNNPDGTLNSAQQMIDLIQNQKPVKPHRDENLINQCCMLGFDRKLVRKALKLTGDVNMAMTFLLDGDISRLIPMSDSEEESAKIQEEDLSKKMQIGDLNAPEQLRLDQLEKEKSLKRASFITTQNFYKFMEIMQKEGLQITKDWFLQNQSSYKAKKFSKIHEQYICNLIQNNILPKTLSLQQLQQSIYEQTFKSFSKDLNILQDFEIFGGNKQDFQNLLLLLNEIRQKLQLLYKLQNMNQLQEYFKEQKSNKEINKTSLQNSVILLIQTLIEGKLNKNPKDFFKTQSSLLEGQTEKIKVYFLTHCLELLFRGLQMFRILEQRYVYKYQKTQTKLNFPDKNQTYLQLSMDKAKYGTKSQSILKQIEEDANKHIGQKTYQYCITCAYGLSQFKLTKENLQELKDLSAQVIDASKIIQITQNQILNQLCQKQDAEDQMQDVEQQSEADFIDFGLGSVEYNELTLQQTKASSTLNIFQMQNIVFSKDKFKITLSHLIRKILESKAKKQSQYRQFSKDAPLQKSTDIKIEQKDSEVDLKKFIADFRSQVLGIGKITVQQNPSYPLGQRQPLGEVQKNLSQPSNEYSAKIFSDAMLNAIPYVCQVSIPSKQITENADKGHLCLKENVVDEINKGESKIKVNLSKQELKVYENIMLQLVQSGQLWTNIVNKSWKDELLVFESMQNWNQMTMIALRNLSCIIRSSFDRKSTLLQKIDTDYKNNNESSLLNWLKDVYFPLRLLGNHSFKVNQKLENDEQAKANVFMIADYNESLDKNVCLFLNELTGYGHLYSNEAVQQRKNLREYLIVSCLETISTCVNGNQKNVQKTQGYLQMDILQKSKLISSIMIIQYLINQYNQFEFNRVVLSRQCFQDTLGFLFNWQSAKKEGFLYLLNTLLEQVQWLSLGPLRKEITSGKLKKQELLEKLQQVTTQAFATQIIDRVTQTLSIVTVYQEEIHKREEKLKQIERSERKKINKQKAKENSVQQNQHSADILMENQQPDEGSQQQTSLTQENQILPNNQPLDQPQFINPNPGEQNESLSDEDDDFQSMSEQEEHSNSHSSSSSSSGDQEPPHDIPEEEEESQADEENFNAPMIPAGIMDESEQEDDDAEEDGDEEEHVEVLNNQNVEVPDEEDDEDEEDLDEDDEEMGGIEEMELIEEYDEEDDMLHAERDLILQMQRQHGRRIDELQERDLLGQDQPFIHHQSNRHRQRNPEDASQLAFGIYPYVQQRQPNALIPIPGPPGATKDESHVYHIEFDIIPAYAKGPFGKGSRLSKSIEEIKREQAKASNNQISSIFQILKPLSLQNFSTLSQNIEQQFLQSMGMRETRRAEVERKERKLKKQAEGILDSDDDDEVFSQEIGQIAGLHHDLNLRRADLFMIEENDDVDVRQELLLNIRAHIDRMEQELQGIVGLGFRNPAAPNNPFSFQIGPHGSLERERVRAAQQASNQEIRDASMSWDNFIQRENETNAQENITSLLTTLVNQDQIVIEQQSINENPPEISSPPVAVQLQEELIRANENSNDENDSRSNYAPNPINIQNILTNPFVSMRNPGIQNPPQQSVQLQSDQNLLDQANLIDQAILSDFFRGFAVQQPLVEQLNQNLQQPNNEEVQQLRRLSQEVQQNNQNQEVDQIASVNDQEQQPDQSQASNSAQISVGAMIRALDDINGEMSNLEQQIELPTEISNQVANFELNLQQNNNNENPVVQELFADMNFQLQPEAQPVPYENIVQEIAAEEEEQFTFGYPNSLLRQNEIEPELLNEVPEDVRAEILSTIQDQFEEWQRSRGIQNNGNPGQINQPMEGPSQIIQLQEQQLDPDLARAIALGLDPEFVANLPAEMIRELLANEQFLADNTGQPIQRAAPQREPEPMDVASIIATVQDPGLRREMLLNLTPEQIDQLPAALRTEAINLRQGGGRHNFMENLFNNAAAMGRRDRAPRVPDRNQRPGRDQDGFFDIIDRYRNMDIRGIENNHLHERMNRQRRILQDPNQISLDEILNIFTRDLDQIAQDNIIQGPMQSKLADKIQMQLIGSSSISTEKDNNIEDRLVRNSLQNLIFQEFRNDTAQLIRLLMKQKSQISLKGKSPPQEIQNKIINSLTFLLQTCSENNKLKLLQFFEMPLDQNQLQQLKLNEQHWTQIFLRICFVLEHFLKKNKKLVEHLLRCLIQSDKEFFGKSDQCIQSMAKILQDSNDQQIQEKQTIRPPLAIIIQVMRDESEARYKLTRMTNLDLKQQLTLKENNSKLVSIKSLTQEIIKQFDLLYDDKLSNPKAGSRNANLERQAKILQLQENKQAVSTFGQLSVDSVKSLTDLLYLPYIDKKLLTALGNFMFRVSSLTMLDFHLCSNAKEIEVEENQNDFLIELDLSSERVELHQPFKKAANKAANICSSNFDLILSQYKQIGSSNLNQINEILWKINNITGPYEPTILGQQRSFTEHGKTPSQINTTQFGLNSKQKKQESVKKLSSDEKQELKDLVTQLKTESSPFIHVLNMFSFFLQKLLENKEQYDKGQATILTRISQRVKTQQQQKDQISALIEEQNKKLEEEAKTVESLKEISDKLIQNQKDLEKLQKDIEEDTKLLAFIELMLKMQKISIEKIQEFYTSDSLQTFVEQTNQFLLAIQKIGGDFMEDDSKMLLNFVFECFYPEMLLEVIYNENKKKEEEKLKIDLDSDPLAHIKPKDIESKYVKMESIQKIISEELQIQKIASDAVSVISDRMEGLEPVKISASKLRNILQQPQLLVFRHEIDQVSDRLVTFNNFCLQNKEMLNKMVKSNSRNVEDESNSDLKRVSQLVKYMPNLLNFDNKRALFKKEIKKMRRQYGAHGLRLNIRRNEIFMDAYSQMGHLTPSELKGKISVDFTGERGQDVGGLTRDFFIELSKEMFNQNYSLFKNSDNGSTYMPNPRSYVQPDHIRYFKFIGRVIGKALFEGCLLECYFVRSIYKMLIGQRLAFKDLEDLDNHLYTGLNWALQPLSDVDSLDETFSSNQDYFGRSEIIDLIPSGRNIDLKNENKEYYVERKAYYTLYLSVQKQIDAFLEGFYEIIPRDLISIFTYKELELLISGMPDYKISDLKANTNYNGYTANSPQIIWFWEIMETLDRTEKGNLLQFVTGSSKVPVEGFANLQGMGGNAEKFQISRIATNDTMRLPQGHTCFNQLDLPEYPSKEILEERLMWAIKETSGFGFA